MQTDELTTLADRFGSDKGASVLCAHGYTRIYDALLADVRDKPIRLLEIGLMHGHTQSAMNGRFAEIGCPSLRMWVTYLRAATLVGFDIVDFCGLAEERTLIFQGDQGKREDLLRMAESAGGAFDVIIDDGSHASHHQQITMATLFPYLAPGGLYCIEDLHYQPEDLEMAGVSLTRELLRDLRYGRTSARIPLDQQEFAILLDDIGTIHFFDSQSVRWPLMKREDALAIITKKGEHPFLGEAVERMLGLPEAGLPNVGMTANWSITRARMTGGEVCFGGAAYSENFGQILIQNERETLTSTSLSRPSGYYRLGDEIDFRLGGNAPLYQRHGWDVSTAGGCWTIARTAQLSFKIVDRCTAGQNIRIEILAQGLVGPSHAETQAEILINGKLMDTLSFGYQELRCISYCLPDTSVPDEAVNFLIKLLNPVSPRDLGFSDDTRSLGLLVSSVKIFSGE